MSDFMALLISQQNDRERGIALERRRLQLEARAQAVPAKREPGTRHNVWATLFRQERAVGNSVRLG